MSQMDAVSPEFTQALQGSFEYRVTVDVWADGEIIGERLTVTGGSLTVTDGQAIRSRVTLTVADPDGLIRPTGDDSSLTPYGPELNIRAGIRLGARTETISLGWFPIVNVDVDQSWRTYRSADDVILVPSGNVSIEAVDRAQWVREAAFLAKQYPKGDKLFDAINALLGGVTPWQPPSESVVDNPAITSRATYDGDRLDALVDLADTVDTDPIVTPAGAITLAPRTWGAPVWTIAGGDDGVLASWRRSLSRDGVYNAVVVYGADPQFGLAPKAGRAHQADGPLRYRQGLRLGYIQNAPILTTKAAVEKAAQTTLTRLSRQRTQTVQVECSPNPALDAGDVVTLQAPRGSVPVKIRTVTLPLTPGRMQLECIADPTLLGQVA